MEGLKKLILSLVADMQGCKATDLVCRDELYGRYISSDIIEAVDNLVETGDLIQIEYALPLLSYRSKSFLLPGKSVVMVHKKEE